MSIEERKYAYVQIGTFSGVNTVLRPELERALGLEAVVIDVADRRRMSRESFLNAPWSNLWPMVKQAGWTGLRRPRDVVAFRFSTAKMYRHRTAVARRRIAALQPEFVFQTQTMFDANVGTVPVFIYTDHTMLANRNYPRPTEDVEARKEWIALEAATYRSATRIFTTSEFARSSLLEDYGCAPDRVVNVRSGTNIAMPAAPPVRRRAVRRILFLGLSWERKGGALVLEAFRRLRTEHPDATLVIAGCTPDVDVPGVTVLGRVATAAVPALLLDADVLCMPSWVEPSAVVYLEAAAYGLPVVATDVGGTPERVLHGQTGLLGPAGDVDALAANLSRLMADQELAHRLGRNGYELVRAEFTWPLVADRLAEGIREVVHSAAGGAPSDT